MSEPTDDDKKKELSAAGSLEDLLRQIFTGEGALSVPSTGRLSPETNSPQGEHLVPKEDT